jgi:hypothetical protein
VYFDARVPENCRHWLSWIIIVLAMLTAFGFLLTAAERFFCPALEIISDYLRLSPAVAGATLLSFGNGAPDVFTQIAAVKKVLCLQATLLVQSCLHPCMTASPGYPSWHDSSKELSQFIRMCSGAVARLLPKILQD